MSESLKILVVEKNNELKDLILFFFEGQYNHSPKIANSIPDAIDELKSSKYSIIIVDYDIEENKKNNIREFIHQREIKIPYFVLSNLNKTAMPEYEKNSIQGLVSKQCLFESLKHCLSAFIDKVESDSPQLEFCKISMRCLIYLDNIDEDCYIQLRSGRHLKLFAKGDNVSQEDVYRYREKGVDKLFVKKEVAQWVMKKFEEKMPEIIENIEEMNKLEKMNEETENSPEENKAQELKAHGLTVNITDLEQHIQEIVSDKVKKTIEGLKKKPSLGKLLKELKINREGDNYVASHINLLCNITVGIAKLMDWFTDATMEKLVFVCIAHDIILADKPKLARIQTMDDIKNADPKLTDKEINFILNHPNKTSDIIKSMCDKNESIPPGVDLIIEQHHERPDGKGFPKKLQTNRITPLSALFIVAHDLTNHILDNPNWTMKKYLDKAKKDFHGTNFTKVIATLAKINI